MGLLGCRQSLVCLVLLRFRSPAFLLGCRTLLGNRSLVSVGFVNLVLVLVLVRHVNPWVWLSLALCGRLGCLAFLVALSLRLRFLFLLARLILRIIIPEAEGRAALLIRVLASILGGSALITRGFTSSLVRPGSVLLEDTLQEDWWSAGS